MLSYYLRGAYKTIHQMEEARQEVARSFVENADPTQNVRLHLGGTQTDAMSFSLDFFLFSLRRLADSMIAWLCLCPPPPRSLPQSLNDLVTKIKNGKHYDLDPVIQQSLVAYWDDIGRKIKGYRDQSNHFAIISGHCVVFKTSDGRIAISMALPDDPEEKSAFKMTYDPGVAVMGFMVEALVKSVRVVNELIERMIDLMAPNDANARGVEVFEIFASRGGPLKLGSGQQVRGEPVPYPVNFHELVGEAAIIRKEM
jgi:hypothetical protein